MGQFCAPQCAGMKPHGKGMRRGEILGGDPKSVLVMGEEIQAAWEEIAEALLQHSGNSRRTEWDQGGWEHRAVCP